MFFSKTVLISVLGLSALAVAAPIENGIAVEAGPAAPCSWFDNLTGRDCDDEDVPAPRSSPRPFSPRPASSQPAGPNWGSPRPTNNNNPYATQPYPNQPVANQPSQPYVAPVSSGSRPPKGVQPRPQNGPRPITAPANDGSDQLGQSSWCNRPDPARRPASCGNGGTLGSAPRSTSGVPSWPSENEAESQAEPEWQQAGPTRGSSDQNEQ